MPLRLVRVNMPIAGSFLRRILKVFVILLTTVFVKASWESAERRSSELQKHYNYPEVVKMVYHSLFVVLLSVAMCYWLSIHFGRYMLGNGFHIYNFVVHWNRRPAQHRDARELVPDAQREPPNPPPTRECLVLASWYAFSLTGRAPVIDPSLMSQVQPRLLTTLLETGPLDSDTIETEIS